EVADVNIQRIRGVAEVITPHLLENDPPSQHLSRAAHEQLQEQIFRAGQLEAPRTAPDLLRHRIELEVGETEELVVSRRVPSEERSHPSQELGKSEGLDQ